MATDIKLIGDLVQEKSAFVSTLLAELDKTVIGQRYMLERMLIGLLANGHDGDIRAYISGRIQFAEHHGADLRKVLDQLPPTRQ